MEMTVLWDAPKPQHFRLYMCDNGLFAPHAIGAHLKDILIWKTNENNKAVLPDGEPKPNKANPMKNEEDIVKGVSRFIKYWEKLCEEEYTVVVHGPYRWLMPYWECVLSNMRSATHKTSSVLKQRFWPKSWATILQVPSHVFLQ